MYSIRFTCFTICNKDHQTIDYDFILMFYHKLQFHSWNHDVISFHRFCGGLSHNSKPYSHRHNLGWLTDHFIEDLIQIAHRNGKYLPKSQTPKWWTNCCEMSMSQSAQVCSTPPGAKLLLTRAATVKLQKFEFVASHFWKILYIKFSLKHYSNKYILYGIILI